MWELIGQVIHFLFYVLIGWQISSRAGFDRGMRILMCVPVLNVIMLFIVAFVQGWQIEKDVRKLRQSTTT